MEHYTSLWGPSSVLPEVGLPLLPVFVICGGCVYKLAQCKYCTHVAYTVTCIHRCTNDNNNGRRHAGDTLVDATRPRVWSGTSRVEVPLHLAAIGAGGYDGLRRQHGHDRLGGFPADATIASPVLLVACGYSMHIPAQSVTDMECTHQMAAFT